MNPQNYQSEDGVKPKAEENNGGFVLFIEECVDCENGDCADVTRKVKVVGAVVGSGERRKTRGTKDKVFGLRENDDVQGNGSDQMEGENGGKESSCMLGYHEKQGGGENADVKAKSQNPSNGNMKKRKSK